MGTSQARRWLVVGSGGAGKSTLSRRMGRTLGLPVVHLDRHYWGPGWTPATNDAWDRQVVALAADDAWIMDGNYGRTLRLRLPRAEAVVFLDLPRWQCLARVVRRRVSALWKRRPDLPEGVDDRLTWEFIRWILTYPAGGRVRLEAALDDFPTVPVVRLGSDGAVKAFLEGLESGGHAHGP